MRRGVTAVEVLLAVGLIALALIPLMTLSQSQERDTYMLEYHTLAQNRARTLIDWLVALDVTQVDRELNARGLPEVQTDGLTLRLLPAEWLPKDSAVLEYTVKNKPAPNSRLSLFKAELGLGRAIPNDPLASLFAIRARVSFAFPGDRTGTDRAYTMTRLVGRTALSHQLLQPWP